MNKPYDETNPKDIETYAKNLIGKSFKDVLDDFYYSESKEEFIREYRSPYIENSSIEDILNEKYEYYNRKNSKGSLGGLLEEYYFYYKPNSDSRPDFYKAETELKVTPYEKTKKGEYKAGERLVITMISNTEPIEIDFEKSHLISKLKLILLILYFRESDKDVRKTIKKLNSKIDFVKLIYLLGNSCKEDLEIIKEDYRIIASKIIQGRAHELSEGDTRYLGACTKGKTAEDSLASQYYSDIPAKRRAFSLKQSYMTYVINKYIVNNLDTYDVEDSNNKGVTRLDSIFKDGKINPKTFDQDILNVIDGYKGMYEDSLYKMFEINSDAKNANKTLINKILGINTDNSEEFLKANIEIKTIRLKLNGRPKESMSFPKIKISDFIEEDYENSYIYNFFCETRFLFVVFKENENGKFVLTGSKFWNMPIRELDTIGSKEWNLYKKKFIDGVGFEIKKNSSGKVIVYNNLPKKKETEIFHMRPHSSKSAYVINGVKYGNGKESDMDTLPNGDKMTHQCFWLNDTYIEEVVRDVWMKGGK